MTACTGGTPRWDHPRMCGEHVGFLWFEEADQGSFPHVRGARQYAHRGVVRLGIIPACAGSTDFSV